MLNELYQLSLAMREANINTDSWYQEYKKIPSISKAAPCVRIVLSGDKVKSLESVSADMGKCIRKFCKGPNGGSFPAMNLSPLYHIEDEAVRKELSTLKGQFVKGQAVKLDVALIKSWCLCDNWKEKKFFNNYRKCFVERTNEIKQLFSGSIKYEPILRLIAAVQLFAEPQILHDALKQKAFELLDEGIESLLVLQILFDLEKGLQKRTNLSVILDETTLEEDCVPSVGKDFTRDFNKALMRAVFEEQNEADALESSFISSEEQNEVDAFGFPFTPTEGKMPEAELGGSFGAIRIRTANVDKPFLKRYNREGNDTFPIGGKQRQQLKDALEKLGADERKNKTWIELNVNKRYVAKKGEVQKNHSPKNVGKNERLFVYPSKCMDPDISYTRQFDESSGEADFEVEAESFREYITKLKELDLENYPDNIRFFILRKIDNSSTRGKVVYTYCSTPDEIIFRSGEWQKAADNIPEMKPLIKRKRTLFPLRVSVVLNNVWKQNGELASNQYKPISSYHGLYLFFNGSQSVWKVDLHRLVENSLSLASFSRMVLQMREDKSGGDDKKQQATIDDIRDNVVFIGMLLYWMGIRKGDYMKEYPYLLGQMLKVSDSLHELYCRVVREKDKLPSQLVGSSLYMAASEHPQKLLDELGQRMRPYIAWAKTHRGEGNKEGPKVRYYLWVYEQLCNQLRVVETGQTRFNDQEKGLLFIGYLASFPKSERKEDTVDNKNDMGGNDDE